MKIEVRRTVAGVLWWREKEGIWHLKISAGHDLTPEDANALLWRALEEAGLPVDRVGGSSMGAVVAAQWALGWNSEQMLQVNYEEFNRRRIDRAFTLPVVSLISARRGRRILEDMFGDTAIEDLWLEYFCVTVNLSRREIAVQRSGSVATWTRAAISPPGIWPPVLSDGELIVDGGVLNNLPADIMRQCGEGYVVTVNVSPKQDMWVPRHHREAPSGLSYLAQLLRGSGARFPNIVRLIYRTGVVTSLQQQSVARELSDIYIEPPVKEFGLTDYKSIKRLADIGYTYAQRVLAEHKAQIAAWRANGS